MVRCKFIVALAIAVTSPSYAGEAHGMLTLDGTTVPLNVANAMVLTDYDGKSYTLVLLTEAPVDLSTALASSDPATILLNFDPLTAETHATVYITPDRVSINAHKAGDDVQYLASRKLGLEAKMAGGDGQPLEGRLRSTTAEMSVQIDVTFKTEILKTGG